MNTAVFRTSLERWAFITTLALPFFLMGSFLWMLYFSRSNHEALHWPMPLLVHGLLLAVYLFCYAIRPRAYQLTDTEFIIQRWIDQRKYSLKEIREVKLIEKDDMRGVMRTFGNGGIFGYTGLFYHSKYGKMHWHATRRSNYVLITLKSGTKIVVTPDEVTLAEKLAEPIEASAL